MYGPVNWTDNLVLRYNITTKLPSFIYYNMQCKTNHFDYDSFKKGPTINQIVPNWPTVYHRRLYLKYRKVLVNLSMGLQMKNNDYVWF